MMKKMILVLQVAATYIGTVVGAGFASGQSIMQFFTVHGDWGAAGIAVSTVLFIWLGIRMMIFARRIKAFSYTDLNLALFGPLPGRIVNAMTFVILLGVTAVMLSGAGSLFDEQLGIPAILGIAISILLTYLILMREMNGVMAINSLVVPMMLFFTVLLLANLIGSGGAAPGPDDWAAGPRDAFGLIVSPFAYAALNFAFAQAVLVPLGSEIDDERVLKWGGFLGGAGLGIMLLASHLSMNVRMPEMLGFEVPIGEIIRDWGQPVHLLFVAVVYGEIFTTLIGNIFGMARQVMGAYPLPKNAATAAMLLATFAISLLGFTSLVEYLYPLFGYMGLILLAALAIKKPGPKAPPDIFR